MPNQVQYYNDFGNQYRDEIIACDNPAIWTTDIENDGQIYNEMKGRVSAQRDCALRFFKQDKPVLDLGCGFGRQSFLLAKQHFKVVGVDSSSSMIDIAQAIFKKNELEGEFLCQSIMEFKNQEFNQIMLLDVYEHLEPKLRRWFLENISKHICALGARLMVTFPSIEQLTLKQKLIWRWIKFKTPLHLQEHPYPIPKKHEFESTVKDLFKILHFSAINGTNFWVLEKI